MGPFQVILGNFQAIFRQLEAPFQAILGNFQAISGNLRQFQAIWGHTEPGKKPVLINKKKAEECTPKLRTENGLTPDIFAVRYTGRGLVVKRLGVLSEDQMLNRVSWGRPSFPFFQIMLGQLAASKLILLGKWFT